MSHFLCSDLQSDLLVSTTCQHSSSCKSQRSERVNTSQVSAASSERFSANLLLYLGYDISS